MEKSFYSVLKGEFLTGSTSLKNWGVIFFVLGLLLVMVWSSHSAYEKVLEISRLNKLKREIRAEYIDTNTTLTRLKLESSVRRKVEGIGLKPADEAPKKLIIKRK